MRRHRVVTALAATLLAALGLSVGAATPAAASCAADAGPDGSPVIFVGTVDGQRRGFTRFAVTEVWAGPDLARSVWVLTGQRLAGVSGSNDADLTRGARYVVGASTRFETDACRVRDLSVGQGRTAGRPATVRGPTSSGVEGADPPTGPPGRAAWWIGPPLFVLALVVGALRIVRGRRPPGTGRRPPGR